MKKRNSTKKVIAPFGVKVRRFLDCGYHPGFEVRPGTFKHSNIYPGCYDWGKPSKPIVKVPRWKRALETEECSKRTGYNDHLLEQRKWMKSINGPGWQDVPDIKLDRGITFRRGERFPVLKDTKYSVPGPGSYGKNHVPQTRIEEKSRAKGFSFSNNVPFEREGPQPRSTEVHLSFHLPPNIYNLKSSIDELISKRVSKRGPCDLFTGPRFPKMEMEKAPEFLTTHQKALDQSDFRHPKNEFKGKFLRCGKECKITTRMIIKANAGGVRNADYPAPNHYDPYPVLPITQAYYPFNSSVVEARPVKLWVVQPPPGRYNPEFKRKIFGDGHRSVFVSKTKRALPTPPKNSWFPLN